MIKKILTAPVTVWAPLWVWLLLAALALYLIF